MSYPTECFTKLLNVRGACPPASAEPAFWLDDLPGVDLQKLADLAEGSAATGKAEALKLIESASRMVSADIEAIYNGHYKVEGSIVTGCSACEVLTSGTGGSQRGTMVKNLTGSNLGLLVIEKVTAWILATGNFNIVLNDGLGQTQVINDNFVEGEYVEYKLNFVTKSKQVRIYLQENAELAQLSCPRSGSGCGCSGRTAATMQQLIYTGTVNGAETSQAYGFIPCASVRCDPSDLLCSLVNATPNIIGLALLYKTAELYFRSVQLSNRNNRTVAVDSEQKENEATRYENLYKNKLIGKGSRGVNDVVSSKLGQISDVCVTCNAQLAVGWATG